MIKIKHIITSDNIKNEIDNLKKFSTSCKSMTFYDICLNTTKGEDAFSEIIEGIMIEYNLKWM